MTNPTTTETKQSNEDFSPRKKVLIAEDDASVRRFLEIVLKKEGYEVIAAEDGLVAINLALNQKIDAFVLDAMMPNLTGYEVTRILRENSDYQNSPIIILSGFEQKPDEKTADIYLVKSPTLSEDLKTALSQLFTEKD